MNVATPNFAGPESAPVDYMGINVGRAVLQRARDFKEMSTAAFEAVANGYEAYDQGERAIVSVTAVLGKGGYISITDNARGMSAADLKRFFSLHAHTERRVGGRNTRGYNGTGKVAPLVIGRSMRVDTVRNGLRNVVVLTLDAVEHAAHHDQPIKLNHLVCNEMTTEPNGTTITITKLHNALKASDIRDIREKIGFEAMMWMQGAEISVNGEEVVAHQVAYDSEHITVSDCGNFTARMLYRSGGHPEELAYTFVKAGEVFVARENFGKEGHKFSNKVHAVISTTSEWARENFENRREHFVSESRDLRMKYSDSKAAELRNFAIKSVQDYMKVLVDEEEQRRKEEDNKLLREWEADLSRAFSALWDLGGKRDRQEPSRKNQVRDRTARATRNLKAKVSVQFTALDDETVPYVINEEARYMEINLSHAHVKALPKDEEDPTRRQALQEIVMDAFVEMKNGLAFKELYSDNPSVDPLDIIKSLADGGRKMKGDLRNHFVERYRAFSTFRSV